MAADAGIRTGPTLACFGALALLVACGNSQQDLGNAGNSSSGPNTGGAATTGTGVRVVPASSSPEAAAGAAVSTPVKVEGCRRDLTVQAVVLGEPPPFDLVIVADHSGSLAWSKDELTAGLRDLLSNVKGRAVRVFLLTPTQYGASSSAARYPRSERFVVAFKDPATGVAYEDAVTNYVQTCKDASGKVIPCPEPAADIMVYTAHGEWQFVMPEPIAKLTPTLSDSEFAAQQAAVTAAILAIGGSGSPNEQPLCTLSRYVSQPAAKLPENVVLLVISDEDDVSKPEDCLLSFEGDVHNEPSTQTNETPCTSGCDAYRYQLSGTLQQREHTFTCADYNDMGSLVPGSEAEHLVASAGGCSSGAPVPCTDEEKARAQMYCPTGLKLTACITNCVSRPTVCAIELTEPMATPCASPLTFGDTTYKNLAEYCSAQGTGWSNCEVYGTNREVVGTMAWATANSRMNLMPGTTTADVARYFSAKRASAFAPGKSLLEGIVLDPSFSCKPEAGQSYATNIKSVIADPTHVFPICESYAPALGGVVDFAQALIKTEYQLTLKTDEHVATVVVVAKDGNERTLAMTDYAFAQTTGALSINKAALRATDAHLRVEVTSDCRPILN